MWQYGNGYKSFVVVWRENREAKKIRVILAKNK